MPEGLRTCSKDFMCSTSTPQPQDQSGDFGGEATPVPGAIGGGLVPGLPANSVTPHLNPSTGQPFASADANGQPIPAPSGPPDIGGMPTPSSDPLSAAIQAAQPQKPAGPTKFSRLLKVLEPMLEGGAIGAFAGKGHPGGGFGAATDFYNQQRAHKLQMAMLQNTLLNSQYQRQLEAARTAHEVNQPYFTRGSAIDAQDANGNAIKMERNPFSGVYEPIPGVSPVDKDKNPKTEMTDQGLMTIGSDGKATPVTGPGKPGAVTPPSTAMVPIRPGDVTSPRRMTQIPGSQAPDTPGAPLHAPGFSTPKPAKVANRNAAGAETDNLIDENPNSPTFGKPIKTNVASRAPLPDKTAGHQDKKDAEESAIEDHVDAVLGTVGNDPDKALAAINADKNVPSQYKARMRNRVREIARPGSKKKQSALDMLNQPAAATGDQDNQ